MLTDAPFTGFIPVRDLDAARAFYTGTLGLRVTRSDPFALVLDAGGTMLRVTPVGELAGGLVQGPGREHPVGDRVRRRVAAGP